MHSNSSPDSWAAIYRNPQFHTVTSKRKKVVLTLFIISALFYFSIPFCTTFFPSLFHVRLSGSLNLGLIYSLLQYPIGGLVAYAYAINMRKLDQEIKRM